LLILRLSRRASSRPVCRSSARSIPSTKPDEQPDVGADVVVAQGTEAGGRGQTARSTLPFVPTVVDALSKHAPDVIVFAAGDIADGRGLAAALMLDAEGA
jgi:NAD(P)H-dependent flavin oxidoreductase YrpB (nitropropane dioxygenase family)